MEDMSKYMVSQERNGFLIVWSKAGKRPYDKLYLEKYKWRKKIIFP